MLGFSSSWRKTTATIKILTLGVTLSILRETWTSVSPISGSGMRSTLLLCSPTPSKVNRNSKLENVIDVLSGEVIGGGERGEEGK